MNLTSIALHAGMYAISISSPTPTQEVATSVPAPVPVISAPLPPIRATGVAPEIDTQRVEDGQDYDLPAYVLGDDNGDGRIDEDESGWDCRTMGNLTCGNGDGTTTTYTVVDGIITPLSTQPIPSN